MPHPGMSSHPGGAGEEPPCRKHLCSRVALTPLGTGDVARPGDVGTLRPSDTSVCWTGAIGHCWVQPVGQGGGPIMWQPPSSAPTPLLTPGRAAADVTSSVRPAGAGTAVVTSPGSSTQKTEEMVGKAGPSELRLMYQTSHATGRLPGVEMRGQRLWAAFPFGGNTPKLLYMNARLHSQPGWALRSLGAGASPGFSILVTQQKPLCAQGQTDVSGHTPVSPTCGSDPSMGTAGKQQEPGMGSQGWVPSWCGQGGMHREIQPQCQPDGNSSTAALWLWREGSTKAQHSPPPL